MIKINLTQKKIKQHGGICAVFGCKELTKPTGIEHLKGYCNKHLLQVKRHGRLVPERERGWRKSCRVDGCNKKPIGHGYCMQHHTQIRKHGKLTGDRVRHTCAFPGCNSPANTAGLCGLHYDLLVKWKLVVLSGGKCTNCGYSKNIRALCFHHNDPTKKDFELSEVMRTTRCEEAILGEHAKTTLLCMNCHNELHEEIHERALCMNLPRIPVVYYTKAGRVSLSKKCAYTNCTRVARVNSLCCTHAKQQRKIRAIKYGGERCQQCGYNTSMYALHFHHTNPKEKDIGIGKLLNRTFDRVIPELDKTILLCSNCHLTKHSKIVHTVEHLSTIFRQIMNGRKQ